MGSKRKLGGGGGKAAAQARKEAAKRYLADNDCGPAAAASSISFLGGKTGRDNTLQMHREAVARTLLQAGLPLSSNINDLGAAKVQSRMAASGGGRNVRNASRSDHTIEKDLPSGWSVETVGGQKYFRHDQTGCAKFSLPRRSEEFSVPVSLSPKLKLPLGWKLLKTTQDGTPKVYYWNVVDGRVTPKWPKE